MNDAIITCPKCQTRIPLTEAMREQLSRDIKAALQGELDKDRAELTAQRQQLEKDATAVEGSRKSIDAQVNAKLVEARKALKDKELELTKQQEQIDAEVFKRVAADRQKIAEQQKQLTEQREQLEKEVQQRLEHEKKDMSAKLIAQAREEVQVQLAGQQDQIVSLSARVKGANQRELALLKQQQELEVKQNELDLEMARRMSEERAKIREEAMAQVSEEQELKLKEREQIIDQMRKQVDELKRKAEQGSQQLQGEVMEIELEGLLSRLFPEDDIDEVGKGQRGGDVLQVVKDAAGSECGRILWESKRTKTWQATWLPKLRQDQRDAKADCCAIVTTALPDCIQTLGQVDDVWVTSWRCIAGLAAALRTGVITTAHARLALKGQQGKMEQVYDYLSSPQFKQRVQGIVEAFTQMQKDLDAEKRALTSHWAKREKQLSHALVNTAGLYGDLHGIIGGQMIEIQGMTVNMLEAASE